MSGTCADAARGDRFKAPRALEGFRSFLISARFPLALLSLIAALELFLVAILLVPGSASGLGAFADDFRAWCFATDASTGHASVGAIVLALSDPLGLAAVVTFVWWSPLREALRLQRRTILGYLVLSVIVVGASAALLAQSTRRPRASELTFPAEALRTSLPLPAFTLEDQSGAPVSSADLKGQVTILTGLYAGCFHTCPLIMGQAKRAVLTLPPVARESVRVIAITLAPEVDSQLVRAKLAARYGVTAPEYAFLGGSPESVNPVLDGLQIARERNPATGMIDHANLFILLDRSGKIAFRFTLGDRQEQWLARALAILTQEGLAGA